VIYLDTHAVVWLRDGELDWLSASARREIERQDLFVSPMVILELELLREIGRLRASSESIVSDLASKTGLRICDFPFPLLVALAVGENWTRDPFDRLIVGHARANDESPLLTMDKEILKNYKRAIC